MRRPQKTCAICESGVRVVDYKDERTLSRFLTERGKILPSRLSGTCARHQRQLSTAITSFSGCKSKQNQGLNDDRSKSSTGRFEGNRSSIGVTKAG